MRLVRIAIASANPTVGAIEQNLARTVALARAAERAGASIVALPEQVLGGYPPEDLVQWRAFVEAQWSALGRFAEATAGLGCASVLGVTVAREFRPTKEYPRGQEVYALSFDRREPPDADNGGQPPATSSD